MLVSGAILYGLNAYSILVDVRITGGMPLITIQTTSSELAGDLVQRLKSAISQSGLSYPPGHIEIAVGHDCPTADDSYSPTISTNTSFTSPAQTVQRITINLAPADIKKQGPAFDLPIAIGVLAATGQLSTNHLDKGLFVGELALDGGVSPVAGILPIAIRGQSGKEKVSRRPGSQRARGRRGRRCGYLSRQDARGSRHSAQRIRKGFAAARRPRRLAERRSAL